MLAGALPCGAVGPAGPTACFLRNMACPPCPAGPLALRGRLPRSSNSLFRTAVVEAPQPYGCFEVKHSWSSLFGSPHEIAGPRDFEMRGQYTIACTFCRVSFVVKPVISNWICVDVGDSEKAKLGKAFFQIFLRNMACPPCRSPLHKPFCTEKVTPAVSRSATRAVRATFHATSLWLTALLHNEADGIASLNDRPRPSDLPFIQFCWTVIFC